ncbi:MAG: DUF1246 domain-containing protein, partial [Candidatus Diapherotrites archaeon]|nr:DUF1246 domain-containing protein [Candidatus Diapherotrites archaeon]
MKIATIGSHSALQILQGAKEEDFETVLVCTKSRKPFYDRFSSLIDHYVMIDSYPD